MDTYNFSLLISKPVVDDEIAANHLYTSGCDDALFSVSAGIYTIEFDRVAHSFKDAVESAVYDVKNADIGVVILLTRL